MVEPRDTPGDEAPTQADDPVTVKAYERIQAERSGETKDSEEGVGV